jgi:hypothetical protein
MTRETNNVIVIDDIEYTEDQLTDQQKVIINHIGDLDRKIRSTQFNLDQLTVGRDAFVNMLTVSSVDKAETEANLATQIEAQKAPATVAGTPW